MGLNWSTAFGQTPLNEEEIEGFFYLVTQFWNLVFFKDGLLHTQYIIDLISF